MDVISPRVWWRGLLVSGLLAGTVPLASATPLFINELHYDNSGSDSGEGVELAGVAGSELDGWQLLFYNGNGGSIYRSEPLSGRIPNLGSGWGVLNFTVAGLQNGAPDGVALIDPFAVTVQFLSYEGRFIASDGPAAGRWSQDIGVAEGSGTAVGQSLQLTGQGGWYDDFTWQTAPATPGRFNPGQQLIVDRVTVPEPPAVALLLPVTALGYLWVGGYGAGRGRGRALASTAT